MPPTTACWQNQCLAFHREVRRWIDQGKETMPRAYPRKAWFFPILDPAKESIHCCTQAKVHLVEQLAVDPAEFRIVLFRGLQGFLGNAPAWPLLAIPQTHDPPVVQPPALSLHTFQRSRVPLSHVQLDLFAKQHP